MFSSEILKLARDIDNVQITIHYGYKFERGKDIFKEYINSYFNMKNLARIENNEGKRFLSKLMLNTPYGRFGLKYQDSITKFVTSSQAKDLFLKYQILENIVIDEENDLELIKYILEPSDVLKDIDNKSYLELISNKGTTNEDFINRSVSIAAMITSYATIFMNKYINIPNNECYYTATDSLVLQHPLESKYVGNDLGQFKYIGKVKRGYFISPGLYCLILEDGRTVIKSKGIDNKELNENNFIEMLHGLNITVKDIFRFKKDLYNLTIKYNKTDFTISPKLLKREPIYINNIVVNTKPLIVKDGNLIKKEPIKLNHSLVPYTYLK